MPNPSASPGAASAAPAQTRPQPLLVRTWPWVLRALWAVLPFTVGPVLGDALAGHSHPVRLTAIALGWLVWGMGLMATLVPHPVGLTTARLAVIAVLGATGWAVLSGSAEAWQLGVATASAVLSTIAIASAETGEWAVDGPAYPNEARFPLRPPATLLPIAPAVAALSVAGVIVGPLMLAARAWAVGALATVVGALIFAAGVRSVHQLSRRFVVFVPAGFVVHDPLVLRDPVLFKRALVESIAAAAAETDALDLTAGAPGLAVEVQLEEKVEIALLSADRKAADLGRTARFMVVPSRPGRVLAEAHRRRFPGDVNGRT